MVDTVRSNRHHDPWLEVRLFEISRGVSMGHHGELKLSGAAKDAALRDMYADIGRKNMFPFWAKKSDVEHDEIRQLMNGPKAVPFRWSYKDDIESLLKRSAQLVT